MAYTLHDREGTLTILLYKAEKPSVCPSIRTFLAVSFSAVAAWIDVRFARRDSYVFWHDEVYFLKVSKSLSFLTRVPDRHPCRSRQPLTTAIQCTVGKALDFNFNTLGRWSGI